MLKETFEDTKGVFR